MESNTNRTVRTMAHVYLNGFLFSCKQENYWNLLCFFIFKRAKTSQILLQLWFIGNITSCRLIRSVIILVIKQIGLRLRGRPILLITRMITDRIGLHSVQLPLLIFFGITIMWNTKKLDQVKILRRNANFQQSNREEFCISKHIVYPWFWNWKASGCSNTRKLPFFFWNLKKKLFKLKR